MQGTFIVIEGIDGAGKATQIELLKKYFSYTSGSVAIYAFPQYDQPTGQAIKLALQSGGTTLTEKIMLFAKDRLAARDRIIADLESNKTVIVDRYISSMLVYAAAELRYKYLQSKLDELNMLELQITQTMDEIFTLEIDHNKMPVATYQLFLNIDEATGNRLVKQRGELDSNERNRHLQQFCLEEYRCPRSAVLAVSEHYETVECMDGRRLLAPTTIHRKILTALNLLESSDHDWSVAV